MHSHEILTLPAMIVPERPAIVFDNQVISFAELSWRANQLANGLAELGVGAGDRVAIIDVNTPRHLELYFAAAILDAIYVPLNFRDQALQLHFPVVHTAPKALFAGHRYISVIDQLRSEGVPIPTLIATEGAPPSEWEAYNNLLKLGETKELRFPSGDPKDTCVLLFTAGTTGNPKAVMLAHQAFTEFVLTNVDPPDPDQEEHAILSMPMYHVAGLQAALASIYGARTLVLQRQFEAGQWMRLVEEHKVRRGLVVPTMLKHILDHEEFASRDLSSLAIITYGGSSMPPSLIERAIAAFPTTQFINAFGQTETGSTITMVPPEDHVLNGAPDLVEKRRLHLTSIGKPLPGIEICIVDENGEPLHHGVTGEIVARGPRLMSGYWKQSDATADAIRNGWLYTGDLGCIDEDGYVYLKGRAKDFIKRGGEMVSPEEIENIIHAITGVSECAVIGVPDDTWGERVVALVVTENDTSLGEATVMSECKLKLARFKRPEQVIFVQSLPRNPLGKVLKRDLRAHYEPPK